MLSLTSCLSLFILVLMFIHYAWEKIQRNRKMAEHGLNTVPAAPRGHWLFGNLLVPAEQLAPTIAFWSKTHGPIMEAFFGIVINDVQMMREMSMSRDFAHRDNAHSPLRRVFNPFMEGILGGLWVPVWKDLRKFTLSTLSQLGFGKASMETQVVDEADELVDAMLKTNGKPFEAFKFIRVAVSNVICRMVFNIRTEIGKTSWIHERLQVLMDGILYLLTQPIYLLFPWLVDYYQTGSMKAIMSADSDVRKFIDEAIVEHEKNLGAEVEEPRDFLDAVIIERRKRPNDPALSTGQIQQAIIDLFGGGTDTTTGFLNWTVAWLLHYPDVKVKLIEEIRQVIGLSGAPTVSAIPRCNYILAFIEEVLRCSSVIDFTFLHRGTKPVVHLGGHAITDDKLLIGNIWAVHNNPDLWEEPEKFRPERHLDEQGRFKKNENMFAFGIGTRRCIGEKLARLEFFIFIVRILQRVDIRAEPGKPTPSMFPGRKPFARHPGLYTVVAKPTEWTE